LAGAGCGWQSADTLGSTVDDGDNTASPGDGASDVDDEPLGPTPDEEADAGDPTDTNPDVDPQPDDGLDEDIASHDDVPSNVYCSAVADWDAAWSAFEDEVLELVNDHRAAGADCASAGTFGPAEPVTMNGALRCAARNHAMDMGTRDYFDHYTPEGLGPAGRLDEAGYGGSTWGENIAWGYATPADVVSGWMASPGHCANIMRSQFTETGIGYYEGSLWTQTFGRP
jgi:uncharacterized protein YkwD